MSLVMSRAWGLATGCAVALVASVVPFGGTAQANSYNWGDGSTVCPDDNYQAGYCVMATSPQQTVKGTTSLQYFVSCADSPNSVYSAGTYAQAAAYPLTAGSFASFVAWTTGSSAISGEVSTASPISVVFASNGDVQSYGATPVKVYNAEGFWDSTTVTFGAACSADQGFPSTADMNITTADTAHHRIALARATRVEQIRQAAAITAREFANGKRARSEFRVRARTATGVELHDRVNLKARKSRSTTLTCPRGMVASRDPQISFGFDALKDASGHRPDIRIKRAWTNRAVTLTYRPRALKYPTVAYTVLSCGKKLTR